VWRGSPDLLFPHTYYGEAKNPFKKGKRGEAEKIIESHSFESGKIFPTYTKP
jgi:hypothetical protein